MSDPALLYNSRISKIYFQYLRKYYPHLDLDSILQEAGIANYEIEDPSHWFTQEQQDRLHDILVARTRNPNVARDAGRFSTSSEGMGAAKQYALGLMSPPTIYLLVEKMYSLFSRGANLSAKKIGPNRVEITAVPKAGVNEKLYQCENRSGMLESIASLFTGKFAQIDHPTCVHRGDACCRYIVSWTKMPKLIWKRVRNLVMLASGLMLFALLFVVSIGQWFTIALASALVVALLSYYVESLDNKALIQTITTQREAAQDNIIESNIRYNNALMVQEIGQATANILDIDRLLETVAGVMQKRLEFDRGMIMLVDHTKNLLRYATGYGQSAEEERILRQTEFNLENPNSKGMFVLAVREKRPFLVNDIAQIQDSLSHRSLELARQLGSQSLICAPIIYEKQAVGILVVDNSKSSRPLRQTDMSLLMGVASQLAISIANARAFAKLNKSERKYRELVENANSIILRMDRNGNITFFNEFAQHFFGYTEKEIIGNSGEGIILPNSTAGRRSFEELIASLQKDPVRPLVSENETETRSGKKVWIAWTYKPIFGENGRFLEILCIGNDITGLKQAGREKEELRAQLQRAQKMEAIGTLAGGVAHDLNNILSGIVSYPELILMDLDENSPLRKPILTIQKSGERAAAIVQDLLTLARRGVEATEVVNLNSIVSEYLLSPEHARLVAEHPDVTIETDLDDNLLNILGSPVHLSKTVMNLVSNSAEAMPAGGKISISSANQHMDRSKIGFDDIEKGDYACLKVADDGVGIASENIERIFEPFYTKKAMGRSGTGLGLAVVWGTVKDHQGKIDIKSTEGKGTEITLYFPATREELSRAADLMNLESLMGKGESILVVDDIKDQREIASEMLEKLGYQVATVSSGEEAVQYLRGHSVDLVVLDMIMEPGMDGLETYQQILAIRPDQKAIIASGYSESIRVQEAQRLGAGVYVKKPYLLGKIGRAVKSELGKIR
jgi:PAS domain S-box-containing protein